MERTHFNAVYVTVLRSSPSVYFPSSLAVPRTASCTCILAATPLTSHKTAARMDR